MQPDDHLVLFTKLSLWPLAVLSAIFGVMLFLFPGHTDTLWSWQIKPDMSAVVVGAGYIFGGCSITSLLLLNRWHSLNTAIAATWAFSIAMLLATLLHLDRFFVGTVRFDIWFAIYVLLPFALPISWLLNRRYGRPRQPGDLLFSVPVRLVLLLAGGVLFVFGLFLFVAPGAAAVIWPWTLTPLMSQVIGGWVLFIGAGAAVACFEPRYSAYRILLPSTIVWGVALLLGSLLHLDAFDFQRLSPWVWFLALLIFITGNLALLVLYEFIRWRRGPG